MPTHSPPRNAGAAPSAHPDASGREHRGERSFAGGKLAFLCGDQTTDFASGGVPLLFLLDELLQGTNSNDRRVGAEGVVRALLNRGATGLVNTHDLALVNIGDTLNGHLYNVHFQEELENGKMHLDYKLLA